MKPPDSLVINYMFSMPDIAGQSGGGCSELKLGQSEREKRNLAHWALAFLHSVKAHMIPLFVVVAAIGVYDIALSCGLAGATSTPRPSPKIASMGVITLLLLAGCEQNAGCNLVKVAQVPLEPVGDRFTVPVTINGQTLAMLLDTGAGGSWLTGPTVKQVNATSDWLPSINVGAVGSSMGTTARINSMSIANEPLSVDRVPVLTFPNAGLGMDVLKKFDLDIDGPNRTLTFYRPRAQQCDNPPWDEPADSIGGVSARNGKLEAPIEINGITVSALVDSGNSWTAIYPRIAKQAGLTEQELANDKTMTITVLATASTQAHVHVFRTIRVGPLTMNNWPVRIMTKDAPILWGGLGRLADAAIGQDILGRHRVWFSYSTERVFMARTSR